jgi:hypothetical protein
MASPYAKSPAAPRSPRPRVPPPSRGLLAVGLPVVAGLLVAGLLVVFFVLPIVIRARCIAVAADHGVVLTVDHVDIGIGEVRLVRVAFSLRGVPQLAAHAADAQVTLSGLTPAKATIYALAVTIDGEEEAVESSLEKWRASQVKAAPAGESAAEAEPAVDLVQASLTWTKVLGARAKLEAPDVSGGIDGASGAIHLLAEHLSLTAGDATLGPWRVTLERGADGTRTNVELDPVVHGGPSALYVRSAAGALSIKVSVPPSPLSRIGFPPKAMKLGSDPNVEAQIAFEETVAGAASLTAAVSLSRAVFSGMPVDAALDLHAAGDVTKGLDVKQGTLKAGPLNANVSGTLKLFPDGARLALAWTGRPATCEEVGKELAAEALGGLGTQLGALAKDVGGIVGLRVTGNAQASGLITLDSRDVNAASFTMTSNETCGLAFF